MDCAHHLSDSSMSGSANEATLGVAGSQQTFHLIGYTHMTEFIAIATFVFFLLFFIWTKSNFLNFAIKMFFFGMGCAGAFYWFQLAGFIMKV